MKFRVPTGAGALETTCARLMETAYQKIQEGVRQAREKGWDIADFLDGYEKWLVSKMGVNERIRWNNRTYWKR